MSKNPQKVSLREFVSALLPQIREVQEAGYTLEEISQAFAEEDVKISASTLKTYLRELSESATALESQPEAEPKNLQPQAVGSESPTPAVVAGF